MRQSNLRNVDLNLLVVLEVLLTTCSVTRTAKEIGLSQPAVSRALSRLRQVFDDPLLIRSGHSMVPTPLAIGLVREVGSILDKTRNLFATRRFDPKLTSNEFRIYAPDATTVTVLSKILKSIRPLAPDARFEFSSQSEDRLVDMRTGDIDLAIDLYEEVPGGFHRHFLMQDEIVCISGPDNNSIGTVLDLQTFRRTTFVMMQTSSGRKLERTLREIGINLGYAVKVANFISAASIVSETDLCLCLPRNLAVKMQAIFAIRLHDIPLELPPHALDLVWHDRVHHHPAHAWLRRQIIENVDALRADPLSALPL